MIDEAAVTRPEIETASCRRIATNDALGRQNGSVLELVKEENRTRAYITTVLPGKSKGYHLHKIRSCTFVVLKGAVRFIFLRDGRRTHIDASETEPRRVHVPPGVFTGICNLGDCEAWIFNYSDPPYDPAQHDEQVDAPMENTPHLLRHTDNPELH